MRAKVYIETTIVSLLTGRSSRDLRMAAMQQATMQWWSQQRAKYELFTSELVITEAQMGDDDAARKRLAVLNELPLLDVNDEAQKLAEKLIADGGVPEQAGADALHIAIAAVHNTQFLLTWNCRHIDNAVRKPAIREICAVGGFRCPEICTPLEFMPEGEDHAE